MKGKILVIDDDITIRSLLVRILRKKYNVVEKEDGLQGLNWLQQGNIPDLIIVDLEMPNMNGFQFIENVRASGFFREIPLLMLSGIDDSNERVKCLRLGANDFIIKPFNPDELDIKIEILLGRNNF